MCDGVVEIMDTPEDGLTMAIFGVEEFPQHTAMPSTITERLDNLREFGDKRCRSSHTCTLA